MKKETKKPKSTFTDKKIIVSGKKTSSVQNIVNALARPNYKQMYEDAREDMGNVLKVNDTLRGEVKAWQQKCTTNTDNLQKALDAENLRISEPIRPVDFIGTLSGFSPEQQNEILDAVICEVKELHISSLRRAEKNRHEFETILKN